ncbi:MAG: hypothetical protein ACOZAR_04045 [Patescibacteria group bacterium]
MDHSILHSLTAPVGILSVEYLDILSGFLTGGVSGAISTTVQSYAWDGLEYALGFVLMIPVLIAYILIVFSVWGLELSVHTNINSEILFNAWQVSMYIVNILVVFFLIFIAFANALRINIETYEIKKTLPSFVISIVLANLSFLIVKVLLDFSDVLVMGIQGIFKSDVGLAAQLMNITTGIQFEVLKNSAGNPITINGLQMVIPKIQQDANIIKSLLAASFLAGLIPLITLPGIGVLLTLTFEFLLIMILMIPAFLILILTLICLARNIVLFILIAIMPIIIVLYFFPPTKQHGQKLISEFFQWLFLGPAIYFILGLATLFGSQNLVDFK